MNGLALFLVMVPFKFLYIIELLNVSSSFSLLFLVLIGKSKILNEILVKMLKFSLVPEYKGKSIVETIEHFLHRKLDNTKNTRGVYRHATQF